MVNGVDSLQRYNGSAWQAINGASTPAFTGIATTSLSKVCSYKKRLWFVEVSSMNLWYLPVDSFAGAAVKFPVGGLFPKGGKVAGINSWTLDSGNGPEDYFVIMSSEGEVAVYAGTDPASAATWSLVGVYYVAKPLGEDPLVRFGGDLLALTELGAIPLSSYAQSAILDRSKTINDKVRAAFLEYVTAFKTLANWQAVIFPSSNALLINLPTTTTTSVQFVMNLTTRSWCRFTGWNAVYFLETNGKLYFASGTAVNQAWVGTNDLGVAITGVVQQAYNGLGYPGQKQISMIRPHITLNSTAQIEYKIDTDFQSYLGGTTIAYTLGANAPGVWGTGVWGTATWGGDNTPLTPVWLTTPSRLGYLHSMILRISSSNSTMTWTATQMLSRPAELL